LFRRDSQHRLALPHARLHEALEELLIERRSGIGFRVPLHADAEPFGLDGFDRLDDAVRRHGADAHLRGHGFHSLMVSAVHAQFAAAIDFIQPGVRLDHDDVPMSAAGGIEVRQRFRLLFGQVQKQRPAAQHVQLLHADADGQEGHLPIDDGFREPAVAGFAAFGHGNDGSVGRLTGAARIEIEPARKHEAVELVENRVEFHFLGHWRQDDRDAAGFGNRIDVADRQPGERHAALGCGGKVCIDADKRARARIGGHGQPSLVTISPGGFPSARHPAGLISGGEMYPK
jgi:hypothetical protein